MALNNSPDAHWEGPLRVDGSISLRRYTTAQRDALSVAEGTVIYNVTTHKLNVRVAAGWEAVTSA